MSKQRLMQAREFMTAKRYDEARAILESLDHPKAKEWLAQIEREQPRASRRSGEGSGLAGYLVAIFVSILLAALLIAGLLLATRSSWYKPSAVIVQAIATATRQPNVAEATEEATEIPTEEAASGLTGVVQSNQSINVRSGPGTNFQSVKSLLPGTRVEILGQNPDGTWRNIRLSDGTEGWVSASLLDVSEALAVPEATDDGAPPTCQGSEAQTWWNGGANIVYNLARLNVKRFQAGQIVAENLPTFVTDLETLRQRLEQAPYPDCVETIHETFLASLAEIHDAAQAYAEDIEGSANTSDSLTQLQTATAQFVALDPLVEASGIVKFSTSCEIDGWLVEIMPDFEAALSIINAYDPATITPQIARPQIFDLRRDGQTIKDAVSPECGATARGHLVNAVGAAEALFQAVYESNNNAAQANLGRVVTELEAFYREMNRIGFPINQPR